MHEMKKYIYKVKMNGNIKKINNVKPVNIWRKVIIRRENK